MATITRTVDVDRPLDEVHHYLADFRTTSQWDPNTLRCDRVDVGQLGVGSQFRNVQKIGPARTTLTYTLDLLEPEHIVLTGGNLLLSTRDEMLFSRLLGGGTRVIYTADVRARWVGALVDGIVGRRMEKLADKAAIGMTDALNMLPVR
jgi:hypothetical protein